MEILKHSGILLFVLWMTLSTVQAQKDVKGSGYILTQQREMTDFTGIEVSQGIDIAIVRGKQQAITVEADDNLFSYIKTTVENKVLRIYIPDSVNIIKYAVMNVLVTMPELCDLKACNHSKIDAWPQVWQVRSIQLEAVTGGHIRIRLESSDIQVKAQTSGDIELKGKTQNLNVALKDSAHLDARELKAENVFIQLSARAKAEIQADRKLAYDLCGDSRLIYRGNPQIENSRLTPGSKIIKEK